MIRAIVLICGFYFLALTPFSVNAMTNEQKAQIKEHFEKIGMECIVDNPITEQDITDLRAKQTPSGPAAPCFLSCVMKKIGVLDEHGMVQSESAMDLVRKVFENEEEISIIQDYLHSCKSVNSEAVTDGEKGCERAMFAFKCMKENAPKFGLEV